MLETKLGDKLHLNLHGSTKDPEHLFNDLKELYTLSPRTNTEGPTIFHTEDATCTNFLENCFVGECFPPVNVIFSKPSNSTITLLTTFTL